MQASHVWGKDVVWGCCNRDSVPGLRSAKVPTTPNTSRAAGFRREYYSRVARAFQVVLCGPTTAGKVFQLYVPIKVLDLGTFHFASLAHSHLPSPAAPSHQLEGCEAPSRNIDDAWGFVFRNMIASRTNIRSLSRACCPIRNGIASGEVQSMGGKGKATGRETIIHAW